jgi:hypothetical protein
MCTRASGRNACANCAEVEGLLRQFKVPGGNRVERLERQMGDWMARVNISNMMVGLLVLVRAFTIGIGCFAGFEGLRDISRLVLSRFR